MSNSQTAKKSLPICLVAANTKVESFPPSPANTCCSVAKSSLAWLATYPPLSPEIKAVLKALTGLATPPSPGVVKFQLSKSNEV